MRQRIRHTSRVTGPYQKWGFFKTELSSCSSSNPSVELGGAARGGSCKVPLNTGGSFPVLIRRMEKMPKEKGDLSRHQDLRSSLTPVLTLRLKQGAHTVLSHRREPKQAELAGRVFQIFKCLLNYYLSFNSNPWRLIFLHLLKEIKKKKCKDSFFFRFHPEMHSTLDDP